MGQLEDIALFIRIVESGGIGKAADQLGLAKSAVSRRLNEMEKRLSTQLLTRTTRRYSLTESGEIYYRKGLQLLDSVAATNDAVSGVVTSLEGTLKITTPLSFGVTHLSQAIHEFTQQHPKVNIQVEFADRRVDLIEEGYELAIRIADTLKDSSLKAKPITPIKHVLCASPKYLAANSKPQTVDDLRQHPFLLYSMNKNNSIVISEPACDAKRDSDTKENGTKGKTHTIPVTVKMKANNGDFLKRMAIEGHGIIYLPTFLTYDAIRDKQLVPILPNHTFSEFYAYAIYPQTRFLSQRCRVFIDFIADYFGQTPYWDEE